MRRLGWGVLAAYGAYLLAANLFLNTPLGEHIANRKPEKFRAGWGVAWSLYPGHVHVRDDYEFEYAGRKVRSVNLGSWQASPCAFKITNTCQEFIELP